MPGQGSIRVPRLNIWVNCQFSWWLGGSSGPIRCQPITENVTQPEEKRPEWTFNIHTITPSHLLSSNSASHSSPKCIITGIVLTSKQIYGKIDKIITLYPFDQLSSPIDQNMTTAAAGEQWNFSDDKNSNAWGDKSFLQLWAFSTFTRTKCW